MSTQVTNMPGCRITTKCRSSIYLKLYLEFEDIGVNTDISPKFTIYGVINFDFKVCRRNEEHFSLFVRFRRKRKYDKLDYCITFTHWTNEDMKFEDLDKWHFICSDGVCISTETIAVYVELKTLSSPCASLYEDTELTDFKLVGDDGYVLLHKAIAAAYSPFFKTMFLGQWKETTEGVVEVSGISKQTLEHLKEYMYLGYVPITCVKQLLLLSKLYMMEDLENRCLFILRAEMTDENIFELMEFAAANKQTRLLYEALDVVQQGDIDVDGLEELLKCL